MKGETADSAKNLSCPYCGMIHILAGICPMVKAFDYYPDGTVKRVEFRDPQPVQAPSQTYPLTTTTHGFHP